MEGMEAGEAAWSTKWLGQIIIMMTPQDLIVWSDSTNLVSNMYQSTIGPENDLDG